MTENNTDYMQGLKKALIDVFLMGYNHCALINGIPGGKLTTPETDAIEKMIDLGLELSGKYK